MAWSSKKKYTLSRSSAEAEFRGIGAVVSEVTWLTALMSELRLPQTRLPNIWCDNTSIVMLSVNPVLHRTRHFEMDPYFICQR